MMSGQKHYLSIPVSPLYCYSAGTTSTFIMDPVSRYDLRDLSFLVGLILPDSQLNVPSMLSQHLLDQPAHDHLQTGSSVEGCSIPPYCRYVTYHASLYHHTAGTSHITLVYNTILQVLHISHWSIPPYFRYFTYHASLYHHTAGTSHITLVHTAILQVLHISYCSIPPYFRYVTYHTAPYHHTAGTSHITLVDTTILQVLHILHWSIPPYFRYFTYYTGRYHHTSGTSHITLVDTTILQVHHISHRSIGRNNVLTNHISEES